MPSIGGPRRGAGRPRSKANVVASARSGEIVQKLLDSGAATPLDVMLEIMHAAYAAGETSLAMQAATAAAPYVHPRLATTTLKNDGNAAFRVLIVDDAG